MGHRRAVTRCKPELNITSMLDVVLNLIMFFILITNFASANLPTEVQAPQPEESVAKDNPDISKLLVNVLPLTTAKAEVDTRDATDTGEASGIIFGGKHYAMSELGTITELLKKEATINPDIAISLRADRNIRFDAVQPVMNAITAAGIKTVNLVATVKK